MSKTFTLTEAQIKHVIDAFTVLENEGLSTFGHQDTESLFLEEQVIIGCNCCRMKCCGDPGHCCNNHTCGR